MTAMLVNWNHRYLYRKKNNLSFLYILFINVWVFSLLKKFIISLQTFRESNFNQNRGIELEISTKNEPEIGFFSFVTSYCNDVIDNFAFP